MRLPQVVKCQPKSKLLRRQKSASEFDGRVAEQGGEDDSKLSLSLPRSYDNLYFIPFKDHLSFVVAGGKPTKNKYKTMV